MLLRRIAVLAWCAVPLIAIAWHYGPGQSAAARDRAAIHLSAAKVATTKADHAAASQSFTAALAELPPDDPARPIIELEQAVATASNGDLLHAMDQMNTLIKQLADRGAGDSTLARAARSELGEAHYHAAWLMRLEGASTEEWSKEADAARQNFRLLAETATDPDEAATSAKNLESAVRLQRLDMTELKGMPLPKNCPGNCQNLSQRKRKQRESRNENPNKGDCKNSEDVRQEMKKEREKGAGNGGRGEGGS